MNLIFGQGNLDNLCSVYSIVNSYKIVMSANESMCQDLFNDIINYLSKKKILKEIILGGVLHKNMVSIMEDVVKERLPVKNLVWRSFPTPTRRIFWNSIQEHLTKEHSAVILSIGGKQEHLTVVNHATPRTLKLIDSGGMKYIRYVNCSTNIGNPVEEKYILYPAQSWFLSRS